MAEPGDRINHLLTIQHSDPNPQQIDQIIASIIDCERCQRRGCRACWPEEIPYLYHQVWELYELRAAGAAWTLQPQGPPEWIMTQRFHNKQAAERRASNTSNPVKIIATMQPIRRSRIDETVN